MCDAQDGRNIGTEVVDILVGSNKQMEKMNLSLGRLERHATEVAALRESRGLAPNKFCDWLFGLLHANKSCSESGPLSINLPRIQGADDPEHGRKGQFPRTGGTQGGGGGRTRAQGSIREVAGEQKRVARRTHGATYAP